MCVSSGLTVLMVSHRKFAAKQAKCSILQVANGRVEEIE